MGVNWFSFQERYSHEFNKFQRFCAKWFGLERITKSSWEFTWGWIGFHWGCELILHRGTYFNPNYMISFGFPYGIFHIRLPWETSLGEGCEMPRYGFNIHDATFWLYTGGEFDEQIGQVTKGAWKSYNIPFFTWNFVGHWIFNKNQEWHFIKKGEYSWEYKETDGYMEEHPVAYKMQNGDIQDRKAKIWKEKRQWARKWLPFWKKTAISIDVEFNEEVGEKTGSYKGGVVGTGCTMKSGESMHDTLQRMMIERKF